MANRYIPYGYEIRNGEYVTHPQEAKAVQKIYCLYEEGISYLSIAALMNQSSHPKYSLQKAWIKNHIKRILENERYTGADGFPAIINTEQFNRVRTLLRDKTSGWQKKQCDEYQHLWDNAVCVECGGRMLRTGSRQTQNGRYHAHCNNPTCGNRLTVDEKALHDTLLAIQKDYIDTLADTGVDKVYNLTADVLKMNNKINSRLAKPVYEEADEIISLIIQGASARYESIKTPLDTVAPEMATNITANPNEVNWPFLSAAISEIRLGQHIIEFITIQGKVAIYKL